MAFLEASQSLESLDIDTHVDLAEIGVATFQPLELETLKVDEAIERIAREVESAVQADLWPLLVGGEQSLALGAARALRKSVGPLWVLHLGARADFLESRDGNPLSHRCVGRRLADEGFEPVTVGLVEAARSELEALEEARLPAIRAPGGTISSLDLERIFRHLGPRVYLTLDLGVFGPSICPGTSHVEARAGLELESALSLLERVFRERQVVGADISELRPVPGDPRSQVFAAWVARRLIALQAPNL